MAGDLGALEAGYAFGYEPGAKRYLELHTAERCAGFFSRYLRPGMSLLDAGCGPGTVTVGLAPMICPGGRLSIVDVNPEETAATSAALGAAGFHDVDVEVSDVRELPFENCTFDALYSQAVIDYLVDPSVAVREFHRVLKPGGVIGLRSPINDMTVIGPYDELLDEGMTLFRRAVAALGGDVSRGALLGRLLRDSGFEQIFMRPSYERVQSREEWPSFMHAFGGLLDGTRAAAIVLQNGWADETRLAEIIAAFDRFGTDTSNCFAFPWGEAVAFKPV